MLNDLDYLIMKWESNGGTTIEQVWFERETDKFLYRGDVATKKKSTKRCYFDTKYEAKAYLIEQAKKRIAEYEQEIRFAQKRLVRIEERYPIED